ncbi:GFA family protein [Marinobacter caseinilyticus]|uniref:GFA family protein n=1 Tax=Marinobacter caseinilyticus TaxID=2692195 RepID=UPI0031F355FF
MLATWTIPAVRQRHNVAHQGRGSRDTPYHSSGPSIALSEVCYMTIKGSCLCGAVTYEITAAFQFLGNCHCSMCRKSNGAAFATWGILNPGTFHWTSGETLIQNYETSPGNTRLFCERCGSTLASAHSGVVGEVVIGTVDGDPGAIPREHIFVGSKAPWYQITDTLPQHEAWPPGLA